MTTEEIDYSSYDEYLKNFREKYKQYPQMQPMSREQFEAAKAKKEAQKDTKAIGATKEELDYMLQNGQISKDAYEKQTNALNTPEVQEAMNAGEKKAEEFMDTKAIGATKEELDYMLQNGQISRAAYDKQIAALQTPEVQEEMAAGEKKADETVWDSTNREVADSVREVTTPKKDDPPEVVQNKNQYNKAMMSIWDAYNKRLISPETAGYFTIDAIATLAKNLGRSIGNVGAQFSGGTIDNGHDESKWGQRQNALLNEEIGKEVEGLGGKAGRQAESEKFDNILKGYQTNRAATVNDMIKDFRDKSEDPSLSETEKKFYQILAVELAGAGLNGSTQIASIGSGVWDDIKSKFGEWFGKKDK